MIQPPLPDSGWLEARQYEHAAAIALDRYSFAYSTEEVMRSPYCGITSLMLHQDLVADGVDASLVITEVDESAIGDRDYTNPSQHVYVVANEDRGQIIVDATYSQFFSHFGLDAHMFQSFDLRHQRSRSKGGDYATTILEPWETSQFPDESLLVFNANDATLVGEWASTIVRSYWAREAYSTRFQQRWGYTEAPEDRMRVDFFDTLKPYVDVPDKNITQFFSSIWDIARADEFEPSKELVDSAQKLRTSIDHYHQSGEWLANQDIQRNVTP